MKHLKLEVDNLTFVRFLVIATCFLLGLFLLWKLLPALTVILVAFVLMLALNPSVHALSRYLPKQNRILATAIVYLVLLSIIGLFFYIILPPMIEQTTNFISILPTYITAVGQNEGPLAELIVRYELQDELASLADNLKGQVFTVAGGLGASFITGVTSFFGGLAVILTVLVLTFLMPRTPRRRPGRIPAPAARRRARGSRPGRGLRGSRRCPRRVPRGSASGRNERASGPARRRR